jgi:DNA anti-recombination protein RmuC
MLSGTDFSGQAFKENAWTIGVNRHGARICTSYRLAAGDQVMVGNPALGHSTKARVTWVEEKGCAFEIGLELSEPQDVWEAKIPREESVASSASGEPGSGSATPAPPTRAGEIPESILFPNPEAGGASGSMAASATASIQPVGATDSRTGLEEPSGQTAPEPHLEGLANFLRDSRAELNGLLAKTQEIQRLSSQAVQSLFEAVHVKLHQELEVAAASFASDIRQRVHQLGSDAVDTFGKSVSAQKASLLDDALACAKATREELERRLKDGVEEHQKKLTECSSSALQEFQHKGRAFFDRSRMELQKTLDDLEKKVADNLSEHLRVVSSDLANEMRRRADVGFEILNEQLTKSARTHIEETQKHIGALSDSALADLSHKASEALQQHVDVGVSTLNEATAQARASLDTYFQQSIEEFQKQISKLSKAALEKNTKAYEFVLHDLQSRLDQAVRALLGGTKSAAAGEERPDD